MTWKKLLQAYLYLKRYGDENAFGDAEVIWYRYPTSGQALWGIEIILALPNDTYAVCYPTKPFKSFIEGPEIVYISHLGHLLHYLRLEDEFNPPSETSFRSDLAAPRKAVLDWLQAKEGI